jgi:acetylornithine deacetylase
MSARDQLRDILTTLVGFDTVSRNSNIALIDWVESYLGQLGAHCWRVEGECGKKANFYARLGPQAPGGLVLSGHTDVVPVDGQNWTSDPFTLKEEGGHYFGRGTCDMKGFIACALAAAPDFAKADLKHPVIFAFSYDEEVGCLGAPSLIEALQRDLPAPAAVLVGEPSSMRVVSAHKGQNSYLVRIEGKEAHSSLPHKGASAIMAAGLLMAELSAIADDLRQNAPPHNPFDPPYGTLTIGLIKGGTAVNIIAKDCAFSWDLRLLPSDDCAAIEARFEKKVREIESRMRQSAPEARIHFERKTSAPPLNADPHSAAEQIARLLTGDNQSRVVSYTTEAGLFQRAGLPAVVCGPGSIEQAHKPDEYVSIAQLENCLQTLQKLPQHLC